jgi:hypothetical protein
MKQAASFANLAALFVLGLSGCGPDLPETVDVTGKVLFQGQPLANAQVGFVPDSQDAETRPALGSTDANGAFSLRTYVAPGAEPAGAMVGDYTVTIQKTDVPVDPVKLQELFRKKPNYVPPPLLPARYGSPTTSPFKVSVKADAKNDFTFDVQDEAKSASR